MRKIKILNTSFANFGSITNILKLIGHESELIEDLKNINGEKIIVPGVGNFSKIMSVINKKNLKEDLINSIKKKENKFFCICVGMQILFEGSEEGNEEGLKIFNGKLKKFNLRKLRVPHQGWNYLENFNFNENNVNLILRKRFYFSHSFYLEKINLDETEYAQTEYEVKFISMIKSGNILATQFHPEKSHGQGCDLIKYFSDEF